jgi:hypothetical protein
MESNQNIVIKESYFFMQLFILSIHPKMGKERHSMQVKVKDQQTAA